jgi:hypothetical protein
MWCYIVPGCKHHCREKEKKVFFYCSRITALSTSGGYWPVSRHEGPGLSLGLLSMLYLWSIKWPWDSYLAEYFSFPPFTLIPHVLPTYNLFVCYMIKVKVKVKFNL